MRQPLPELDTDRLRLRALRFDDLDAYARMYGNPDVMRFLESGVRLTAQRHSVPWRCTSGIGSCVATDSGPWRSALPETKVAERLGETYHKTIQLLRAEAFVYRKQRPASQ